MLWLLGILCITSCSHFGAYQPTLHQGKELNAHDIAKLQSGMTQKAVIAIMGKPITKDPYNNRQWTYVYRIKHYEAIQTHFLLIQFSDKKRITHVEMDPALQAKISSGR